MRRRTHSETTWALVGPRVNLFETHLLIAKSQFTTGRKSWDYLLGGATLIFPLFSVPAADFNVPWVESMEAKRECRRLCLFHTQEQENDRLIRQIDLLGQLIAVSSNPSIIITEDSDTLWTHTHRGSRREMNGGGGGGGRGERERWGGGYKGLSVSFESFFFFCGSGVSWTVILFCQLANPTNRRW